MVAHTISHRQSQEMNGERCGFIVISPPLDQAILKAKTAPEICQFCDATNSVYI